MEKFVKILYTDVMDNKSYIKSLLVLNKMPIAKLAQKMTELLGKKYSRGSIYGKLDRDSLTFKEIQAIAKIIGYKVKVEP